MDWQKLEFGRLIWSFWAVPDIRCKAFSRTLASLLQTSGIEWNLGLCSKAAVTAGGVSWKNLSYLNRRRIVKLCKYKRAEMIMLASGQARYVVWGYWSHVYLGIPASLFIVKSIDVIHFFPFYTIDLFDPEYPQVLDLIWSWRNWLSWQLLIAKCPPYAGNILDRS